MLTPCFFYRAAMCILLAAACWDWVSAFLPLALFCYAATLPEAFRLMESTSMEMLLLTF